MMIRARVLQKLMNQSCLILAIGCRGGLRGELIL